MAVLTVAIAGAGYGVWYLFLKPSGPPPVSIGTVPLPSASAVASAAATAAASSAPSAVVPSAGASAAPTAAPSAVASSGGTATGIDGTWNVNTTLGSFSDFTGSFVGYRVKEQMASIGANTAVGRTPEVSGAFTIQGATVTAGEFTADLTGLQSDDDRRDGQLSRQGIQTSRFPAATFKLTAPIDLGTLPADGVAIQTTATGDFTLHGVTKSVQIPLEAKRSADTIVITGSLTVVWTDYNIDKPNSFAVLSIEDQGIMELQLLFTKAS
jgi:polyisoprenoid-binding protein YceI